MIVRRLLLISFLFTAQSSLFAQGDESIIDSFRIHGDIKVTFDRPENFSSHKKTIVTFFALPNGNTTDWTMGKKMKESDDWHFDIQHIKAQTRFIRQQMKNENFIVIYMENNYRSWPAWKQKHPEFPQLVPHLVDSLSGLVKAKRKVIYLNGHSGGGSFIFDYLTGVDKIPASIKRISFLDSDYNYDSTYYPKFKEWLQHVKGSALNVFAYNDSVALYNGKPFVSATGGTWYRSHLMLHHFETDFPITKVRDDSLVIYKSKDARIQFFFKTNPKREIYHTKQVELNGFIHSIFCGTPYDSKKYTYYSGRAYNDLIE